MKKYILIAITLVIAGLVITSGASLSTHKSVIESKKIVVTEIDVPSFRAPLKANIIEVENTQGIVSKGDPVFDGPLDQLHPAIAESDSGNLGGVYYDETIDNLTGVYSDDNGQTWTIGITSEGPCYYPSFKRWNDERIFGTFVPSALPTSGYGGMTYLVDCEDIMDPTSYVPYGWWWNQTTPEYNYGFHDMVDADIACDNSQGYGAYGLISCVMSKTNDQHELFNIPFFQYADPDAFPRVWGEWNLLENCYHTDAALDPIEGDYYQWMYAVYDWNDLEAGDWKLILARKDFDDLIVGQWYTIEGEGNLKYPAIACYDDHLIILAETDESGNKDIICLYSDESHGDYGVSYVASEGDDEMYPDIRHVGGLTFVSTFMSNGNLYSSVTEDAGATWSDPEQINDNDGAVILDHKTSDLSEKAGYVLWEEMHDDVDIYFSELYTDEVPHADVPTWEVGDSWTYDMELYIASSPNVTDDMITDFYGELTYEVVDDVGDIYTLNGHMSRLFGLLDLPGNIDLKPTRFTQYNSILEVQKDDLALSTHWYEMKGIGLLTLGPLPLPIPIQMQAHRSTECDPAFHFMPFPLYDGDSGTFASSTLYESTETTMFWGLILVEKNDDIEWNTGEVDYTVSIESITVEAGIFDAFNVSGEYPFGDHGIDIYRSYYVEEIGNVAKSLIRVDFGETEETYYLMTLELKSTTYEP